MKILKDKELNSQIIRYILISLFGYTYIFASLYLLVSMFKVNQSIAFMIVYGIWYLLLYFIQLKLLFKTKHKKNKLIKFSLYLITFYLVANLLYSIAISLRLEYMVANIIAILILMPLRFIVSKYYVYN
ncbi:GtrA family protein [Flavobacterium sp. UMI-01]|uniref:GtrA family protein n=1 Tax=Flavobacterium sp. UMI-01 TaxID=1441053 RepID=UPI001C7D870A